MDSSSTALRVLTRVWIDEHGTVCFSDLWEDAVPLAMAVSGESPQEEDKESHS